MKINRNNHALGIGKIMNPSYFTRLCFINWLLSSFYFRWQVVWVNWSMVEQDIKSQRGIRYRRAISNIAGLKESPPLSSTRSKLYNYNYIIIRNHDIFLSAFDLSAVNLSLVNLSAYHPVRCSPFRAVNLSAVIFPQLTCLSFNLNLSAYHSVRC